MFAEATYARLYATEAAIIGGRVEINHITPCDQFTLTLRSSAAYCSKRWRRMSLRCRLESQPRIADHAMQTCIAYREVRYSSCVPVILCPVELRSRYFFTSFWLVLTIFDTSLVLPVLSNTSPKTCYILTFLLSACQSATSASYRATHGFRIRALREHPNAARRLETHRFVLCMRLDQDVQTDGAVGMSIFS